MARSACLALVLAFATFPASAGAGAAIRRPVVPLTAALAASLERDTGEAPPAETVARVAQDLLAARALRQAQAPCRAEIEAAGLDDVLAALGLDPAAVGRLVVAGNGPGFAEGDVVEVRGRAGAPTALVFSLDAAGARALERAGVAPPDCGVEVAVAERVAPEVVAAAPAATCSYDEIEAFAGKLRASRLNPMEVLLTLPARAVNAALEVGHFSSTAYGWDLPTPVPDECLDRIGVYGSAELVRDTPWTKVLTLYVKPGSVAFFDVDPDAASGCSIGHLLISEIQTRGSNGGSDEFIELFNPTPSPVMLDGSWSVQVRSSTAASYGTRWTGKGAVLPAGRHFLIVMCGATGYDGTIPGDDTFSPSVTDASSVRLMRGAELVDALCFGYDAASRQVFLTGAGFTCEGTPALNPHDNSIWTNVDASLERQPGGTAGNCTDTGDNTVDVFSNSTPTPLNTQSPPTP